MVVSIHIPKCAGTSFRRILRGYYRERTWDNYGRIFSREEARPGIVPAGTLCIHGHFLADAFDHLFPDRQLITWLRHPVERVVSTYHHFLRTPDFRDDCCRALYEHGLSLVEFADLDWMCNTANRYLTGKSCDDFAFVGIVEQFGESLRQFEKIFGGCDRPSLPIPRENTNPARTVPANALSTEDFAHILSRNASDLWWYEQASAGLLRNQRARRVISLPAAVNPSHPPGRMPGRRVAGGGSIPFGLAGACWPTSAGRPAVA